MAFWLGAACLALGVAVVLLSVKIYCMRRAADEIRREFSLRLDQDTNTLISLPSRDRAMARLAAEINGQLRLLRRERRRFQQGDQSLRDAVAGISHDLRTPLTAICGYLDLLEQEEKSQAAARYLEIIGGRVEHLRELAEELLRFSVALREEEELPAEEVSLNRAVEEGVAAYYAALRKKGIIPAISLPNTPVLRQLNPGALRRVLDNLLSNALKYSGGDLRVLLSEDGTLTFSNTAPGLTAVTAQQLFARYFTVETGQNAAGLGLSIARSLTERMGGSVQAQYQNGVLTVVVRFPQDGVRRSAAHFSLAPGEPLC